MKKFVDLLTDEQKDELKNCYLLADEELWYVVGNEDDEINEDNFRVLVITDEGLEIATAENICFYAPENKDFDFMVGTEGDYFGRDNAPEEVVEFLDNYLNKAKYENK